MKKKLDKELVPLIILVPLFIWTALYISNIRGGSQPAYSVINRSTEGYSLFYDALKEMNYSVDRSLKALEEHEYSQMQIVVESPHINILSEEAIKDWISYGGVVVYLSHQPPPLAYASSLPSVGSVGVYQYNKGFILTLTSEALLNSTLKEDYTGAYQLLQAIEGYEYSHIYFNEYYIFMQEEGPSLWEYIPLHYKFLFYQLLLVLVTYFYYKGKGFGRPIPLYEETERIENEYTHTAAALYMQGGCWDLILDSYYRSLLRLLPVSDEELAEAWKAKELPEINKIKKLQVQMERPAGSLSAKEYLEAILLIEELKSIVRKGREIHWKTMRR